MAHFAELDEQNIVIRVLSVPNEQEHRGQDYLVDDMGLGGRWKQTSYNTRGGVHHDSATNLPDSGVAFRKNYAGSGMTYDPVRDAFIPPKPYPLWILNEDTCRWKPPIEPPDALQQYWWNESTQQWFPFT